MTILNELQDNSGARKTRKRVGRGIASGKGKTCGRGVKGQKSRTGVSINGFEGGQMPIYRRLPKRGFSNPCRQEWETVNLFELQRAVEAGKIKDGAKLDSQTLSDIGLIRNIGLPVKLLGKGELKSKLDITVDGASASAIKAVEVNGGSVTLPA